MGHGSLTLCSFASRDHLVGLGRRTTERLLDIDTTHTGLNGRERHFVLRSTCRMPIATTSGFVFAKHLSIVGKALRDTELFEIGCQTCCVGIINAHDFGLGQIEPHRVESMAIVTATRVADDRDAHFAIRISSANVRRER